MTKRQAAKITFENENVAETIKENAARIFAGFPKIKVKYGRDKDSRDNTPPPPEAQHREIPSRDIDSNPFSGEVYDGGIENNFKITRTVSPLVKSGSSAGSSSGSSTVTFGGQPSTSITSGSQPSTSGSKPTEKASDKGFSSFLKKSKTAENFQDTADNAELEQMAQKRFTILESRDAELRDLLANVRDGAQVGICYDLCPEKERYRRIVQSDIAGFEKENGKVNLGRFSD